MTRPREIIHCRECGAKSAWLLVEGERSLQYGCRCGAIFEVDRPAREPVVKFETKARWQGPPLNPSISR